jgi:hypothetical protein
MENSAQLTNGMPGFSINVLKLIQKAGIPMDKIPTPDQAGYYFASAFCFKKGKLAVIGATV